MASNKEIRPTWFYWDAREASSWEIIFFAAYLKKQHKGGDKGCEHRQTFPSISKFLFLLSISTLLIIFFLRLPSWSDISAPTKNLRKTKLQKNKVECYHCRYILPIPVYCIGRHLRKTNNLRTIQDWLAISSKTQLLRFPKNTNCLKKQIYIGTVKMVKDHCEATAR